METLERKCEELNISDMQKLTIKKIICSASKKSLKEFRYSKDWIILSLLIHIKSSANYEFLRRTGVLSLPAACTLRRYLSLINGKCGFDDQFFERFKQIYLTVF